MSRSALLWAVTAAPRLARRINPWPLRPVRPWLVKLHRYVGLTLAPLLIVVGLTGSVSVFRAELDTWLNPDLFLAQGPDRHLPLSVLAARVAQAHPDQPLVLIQYRAAAGASLQVYLTPMTDTSGHPKPDQIFLDPEDGHELGSRQSEGCCLNRRVIIPFIYRVHYSLLLGRVGLWILGVSALIWTLDCLNGLVLTFPLSSPPWNRKFWPGWQQAFLVSWGRGILRLSFDLHRSVSLWLWFLFLGMAISGVSLALGPQVFEPIVRSVFPVTPPPGPLFSPIPLHPVSLDEAETLAWSVIRHQGRDRLYPAAMMWTHRPETALFYLFTPDGRLPSGLGSPLVRVNLETGAVTQISRPGHGRTGDLILNLQDPFHSGRLAGLVGRIMVCLSGIATALLCMTGLLIWWRKRKARLRRS